MDTKRRKIIIDTDIGDDIDDAFALLYAMEMGLEIIGITTVFKNTEERARITKKLLKLYGNGYESVPVYAGYGLPLGYTVDTAEHLCQYTPDTDDEVYAPDSKNPADAVDFIIDSCMKYGEELTVIALGPFTNIAKVIEKRPDALLRAGRLIIMGGAYFKQYADWNVMCDPEAASIMFSVLENIHCLGADVTHLLGLSKDDDKRILSCIGENSARAYVSGLYAMWKASVGGKIGVLHDPLTIHYAINPDVCKCEASSVAVITEGFGRGLTLNVNTYTKAYMNAAFSDFNTSRGHFLAKSVDRDEVISGFMRIFSNH